MTARRFFWITFIITLVINGVWWIALQPLSSHETTWNFWFNAVYGVPFLIACAFYIYQASQWPAQQETDKQAIIYIAAGIFAHGIAQLIWTFYNVILHVDVPVSSSADVFYTAAVLLQMIGLVFLLWHRTHHKPRPLVVQWRNRLFVIGGTMALSYVLVKYVLPSEEGFIFNINTFYTITSFVRAFLVLLNLYRQWHVRLRAFLFVYLVASTALGMADVLYSIRSFTGEYWNGDIVDGCYALGAILLVLAAYFFPNSMEHGEEEEVVEDKVHGVLRSEIVFPLAIILFGVMLAGRTAEFTYRSGYEGLLYETQSEAVQVSEIIQSSINTQTTVLSSLVGFFQGSQSVTQEEFNTFTDAQFQNHPRISELGFIDPDGVMKYSTFPPNLGMRVSDDPNRAVLLADALQEGKPIVSKPTINTVDGTAIVRVYAPIYKDGTYVGTATLLIHLPKLFEEVDVLNAGQYHILVNADDRYISLDGEALYDETGRHITDADDRVEPSPSLAIDVASQIQAQETVDLLDTEWTISVFPDPANTQIVLAEPLSVFLTVFLVLCALAGVAFIISSQQARLRSELRQRTKDLRQKLQEVEQRKFFLDNVSDAVIALDTRDTVLYANQAAQDLFRLSQENVAGFDRALEQLFEDAHSGWNDVKEAIAREKRWEGEIQVRTGLAHQVRDVLLTSLPLLDSTKKEVGYLLVGRDITSRKEVERAKNQFVSLVSHQLRSPMTQLRWMVEQMLEQPRLTKPIKDQLQDMERIVLAENKLVGDLLNVSRIERGVLKIDLAPIAVKDVVKETVAPLRLLVEERHMKLDIPSIDAALRVNVDREKLAEALRNLLDNALRYSPEHSTVVISVEPDGKQFVTISIQDQGPGIPQEAWDHLFDVKTAQSASGSSTSTGLGLYLTKKFVEAMEGTIVFETSSHGTVFTVRLPRLRGHG